MYLTITKLVSDGKCQYLGLSPPWKTFPFLGHCVSRAKSLKIVTFLVENGANMNTLDADGYSPFHKAVKSDDENCLRYYIRNGADGWK